VKNVVLLLVVAGCVCVRAQSSGDPEQPAGSDADTPAREMVAWNHYEGKYFSIRGGGGFLVDYVGFAQDDASKEQVSLGAKYQLRDARALFKGRLKFFRSRDVSWTAGIMYDPATGGWQFRQTGINISVPELWGDIFVGRTKEGVSLNKVMIGYGGWTMERATINDAALPILADGIKWTGYARKINLFWNVGTYGDWLSHSLAFSRDRYQTAGRIGYVKFTKPEEGRLLHLGVNMRYALPENDKSQLRSRPEAYPAPYFVDTGTFASKNTKMIGPEVYWREGPFLSGAEYYFMKANAPTVGNPWFHGGEAFVSWLPTGETRSYNTHGSYFNQISPKKTVFEGGHGAVELVLRYSYIDLDSAGIRGGKFWRVTPMASWFLSDHVRLEFNYGYGSLNRFEMNGRTSFFQTRIQLQL
jgi:phosphate-selective porin OprO/OprP